MKTSKIISVLFLLFLQGQSYASSNKNMDKLALSFMKQNHVEGLSIALVNKSGQIQTFNYGYANEVKKIPASDSTIYRVASFSKTYTATLAAIAAEEGMLNLNTSISQYLPVLKNNTNFESITPWTLLAHVSALPFDFSPTPHNSLEVMADLNKFIPAYAPGRYYAYSNAGIGTMGYALQNTYAESYEMLLANKIVKPLQLQSTYLNLPINKEQYVALGHEQNNKLRPYERDLDIWFAAASLKSTIGDMGKFLSAQMNYAQLQDPILRKAIPAMHQNKYCLIGNLACEQLGWQAHVISALNNSSGDTFSGYDKDGKLSFTPQKVINNPDFAKNEMFIDKSCGGYGMSGYMAYVPEKKTGVVILLNKSVGDTRIKLGRDILKTIN